MHAELTVSRGANAGRCFTIRPGQRFDIGRIGASVTLAGDSTISRCHARIELRATGEFYVVDLNSRNGTYLGKTALDAYVPTQAESGQTLNIGDHRLHIMIYSDAAADTRKLTLPGPAAASIESNSDLEILGILGKGSSGTVYSAYQKLMDRRVAIKCLDACKGREFEERFLREGRLACRVRSPNVVEVYDFRVVDGRVVLIMELVDGGTLKDRLASGPPIPIPEALSIAEDVARGLDAIHIEGVVHRDVKPSNVLLDPKGVAKLNDFGIAKDLDADRSLTPSGAGFGTMPYVAPEQAGAANTVDTRADLYSLGATLFHMLTGSPPFKGRGAHLLIQIMDCTPPAIAEFNPACPGDLDRFVAALLDKEPERRPANAAQVAHHLSELRRVHYPEFTPLHRDRRSGMLKTSRPFNAEALVETLDAALAPDFGTSPDES